MNLTVSKVGFTIHSDFPHFGATPDGLLSCNCCGEGVLEIKCPFLCREQAFVKSSENSPSFCLDVMEDGTFKLKKQHSYYFQVQLQMKLCERNYADFVVWRESELVVLRIEKDDSFLEEAMHKATDFFKYGILPEVLGRWYTRNPTTTPELTSSSSSEDVFCYCREL